MQVKILRTTVADKRFVRAGVVVDLSDIDARALILLGKAVLADAAPEPVAEGLEPVIAKTTGRGRAVR